MKLFASGASPFVRKVLVVAHEVGLADAIEKLPSAAHPVKRDRTIMEHNPLAQVPTLILDDGQALADSRVICEYLDDKGRGGLFPAPGPARWRALAEQSLGDGLLDAALLTRYERTARPDERQWTDWINGQLGKIASALAVIEAGAGTLGDRVDIGTITFGCALGYLDLRFPELDWRKERLAAAAWFKSFDERPSMKATRPAA